MAETSLWDGLTPTRSRFITRTFSWDTALPTKSIPGEWVIIPSEKRLYQNISTDITSPNFVLQFTNDEDFQLFVVGL